MRAVCGGGLAEGRRGRGDSVDVHLRTSTMTLRKRAASPSFPYRPRFASAMQSPLTEPFFASSESRMRADLEE